MMKIEVELTEQVAELIRDEVRKQLGQRWQMVKQQQKTGFDLLSHRKAAEMLDITPKALYEVARNHKLPVQKLGNKNYYRPEDLLTVFIPQKSIAQIKAEAKAAIRRSMKGT